MGSSTTARPSISKLDLSDTHSPENQAGSLNSGRVPLSARRLSKAVLHADSTDTHASNTAGFVMINDAVGTPRSVRVVQKEEEEGINMIRVGWVWSLDGKTFQIELRHGRKSGMRKIYINKQLVERVKQLKDLLADAGSVHEFALDGTKHTAQLHIVPKGFSGFTYQMLINGHPIEQNWSGLMHSSSDVGSHLLDVRKPPDGAIGLTLHNRESRIGCAIAEVIPGGMGERAGLCVGDVVLAVDGSIQNETIAMSHAIAAASGVVSLEIAGAMPSAGGSPAAPARAAPPPARGAGRTQGRRVLPRPRPRPRRSRHVRVMQLPLGVTLRSTSRRRASKAALRAVARAGPSLAGRRLRLSAPPRPLATRRCRVGVLVTDVAPGSPASRGGLVVGDILLSVNGKPVETAERALKVLGEKNSTPCNLVVAGALVEVDPTTTC